MDITLLPPSTILSRHSHLALLPSPFPNVPLTGKYCSKFTTEHGTYPKVPYKMRRRFECGPPQDGCSPIMSMPEEIVLSVFRHLDWDDLVNLRPVCKQWARLSLTPALHTSLTLPSIPHPLPLVMRDHLLRSVRHLNLHLFPYPTQRTGHPTAALLALLDAIPPDQLLSLSLPFSAPYVPGAELGMVLKKIGSRLEFLDLKGSGLIGGRWTQWLAEIGKDGPGLRHLDVGFTSISSLPLPGEYEIDPFRNLRTLKMASCSYLSPAILGSFLAHLPPTIECLDLSRLDHVSFEALWDMRVVVDDHPTELKEIKVVGIDHLTRRDIRRLKAHWEDERRSCRTIMDHTEPITILPTKWRYHTPPPPSFVPLSPPRSPDPRSFLTQILSPSPPTPSRLWIAPRSLHPPTPPRSVSPPSTLRGRESEQDDFSVNIVHSAILESEDEEGYRQFIGEVANGTVPVGLGLGLGIQMPPERQSRARWVEVDGGGIM